MRAWEVDWGLALAIGQCIALAAIFAVLFVVLARVRATARLAAHSVAVSQRAARASERRARAAESALHEARRPWIVADALRLTQPEVWSSGRFDAQAELVLRNTGLMPARSVMVQIETGSLRRNDVDVLSRARLALFDARVLTDASPAHAGAVIAPGQEFGYAATLSAPDVRLPQVASGGLSVIGRVDYEDADGARHTTCFAFDLAHRDGAWRFDRRREVVAD